MKTIAVFTGNRAEYGLLYPVISAIHQHPGLALQLYVGGDHTRLGTVREIEEDGLPIFRKLQYGFDATRLSAPALMAQATASIMPTMQQAFSDDPPDFLLVLGDRYETFAAVLAAFYTKIPIAHIGGGDVTEGGCVDDVLRFLISDLAQVHFVISKDSGERLIVRGSNPADVHVTGSPVIDNLANTPLIERNKLCEIYRLKSEQPIILFTQHPVPAEGEKTVGYFQASVAALADSKDVQVIATVPNQDGFGQQFSAIIADSRKNHANIRWVDSLGREHYLSWLSACDVVVGNSSSGLIETPFFRKPSITVGDRQKGRLRADNVIACDYGVEPLKQAVLKALTDRDFQQQLNTLQNPFGDSPCAKKICEILLAEGTR